MEDKPKSKPKFKPNPSLKLMDQVREVLRYHHYAYRTEQSYCQWILRYIRFHGGKTHPKELGVQHVERFLSNLVTEGKVAASTQSQALNAIVFLYREVLHTPLDGKIAPIRTKRQQRPPTVMTQKEVKQLLRIMNGTHSLMARVLYGGGLRLMECIRLRLQDIDFGHNKIYVRGGKGGKDRTTLLPKNIRAALQEQIDTATKLHQSDLEEGFGRVYLPGALSRKYPNANKETGWQYLFPAKNLSIDPRSGRKMRHHVLESGIQKSIKSAAKKAGIIKRIGCHTMRHSFATHLLENGVNIRIVQQLMGHADVKTTEIYTHVMERDIDTLDSPLDKLDILDDLDK